MLEFRSDTFTLPTPEMMTAIGKAPLGDDGYREDPTVIRLEELAARKLDKEAACLTPSGTMANLASILTHCPAGTVALVGDQSDIYAYEDQGLAALAGVELKPVPTQPDGVLLLADLEEEFAVAARNSQTISLVCLENPHNLCGGVVLSLDYLQRAATLIHDRGARFHLDGARLFNAAVRMGIDPAQIVKYADSIQFCLSKGLSAPIGSILAGRASFIEAARTKRQMLGGNMRQAGIIAAAGIVALESMVNRLEEDHRNARRLAEGMAAIPGVEVDLSKVQTNTVVFRVTDFFDCDGFIEAAARHGLNVSDFKHGRLRAVVHYGITEKDIDEALRIITRIMKEASKSGERTRALEACT